jgi:heme oxygenase
MDDIRIWLARVTAPLHRRVDAAAAAIDLTTADGAAELVAFMARGVRPVERALDRAGAGALYAAWSYRRRADTLPDCAADELSLTGEAEVWGALYVLEGSRLGGRFLSRAPHLAHHPFFADSGDRAAWPHFLACLAAADSHLDDRAGMATGASAAFAAFLTADRNATTTDADAWRLALSS